jgi:DNA-directed RNA polymerase subunit alpha
MIKPQFTIKTEEEKPEYSRFIIEPLPQGFGDTLGNGLRRVLYTAISGSAVTSVKISGVNHQFTTLEGMREDVVQLILSLKQVRPRYSGDKPAKITLEAVGPGEVTASRFDTPPDVVITNPDLVLAHLADKNSKLELEATVESGRLLGRRRKKKYHYRSYSHGCYFYSRNQSELSCGGYPGWPDHRF